MAEQKKPLPGYAGFVPNCNNEIMPHKTSMNTRMPLQQRTIPVQATKRPASVPASNDADARSRIRSYFLPKRFVGTTTYTQQTIDHVRSQQDVPVRVKEPHSTADNVALPSFTAKTEKQISTHTAKDVKTNFYSEVRKAEREDDDARRHVTMAPSRSGAAHNLRTVDIMRKRENDARLAPTKDSLLRISKRPLNGIPPPSSMERVKLTALPVQPSNRTEYGDPKLGMTALLANAEKEQNPAKKNNKLMTITATTRDMFAGTAKDREDVIPGYMGHVPASKGNIGNIKGDGEVLRNFSKCSVRLSAPPAAVPGYSGYSPDRARDLDLTSDKRTASNRYAQEAVLDVGSESKMNNRDGTGRKNAVRGFFTQGYAETDSVIADQFCSRFRPLEGVMKMGGPANRNWTTEKELHRRIAM